MLRFAQHSLHIKSIPWLSISTMYGVAGDIVGALLNRTTKTISFTKNGIDLGIAFKNVQEDRLFPSVGMRTPNEEVCLELLNCLLFVVYPSCHRHLCKRYPNII